jgi:hypothetical protein
MRMRPIILPSVACLTVPHFPHYLKRHVFFGKMLQNTKCVFWFSPQLSYEKFLILRKVERDIVTNAHRASWKVPVILLRF